MMFLDQAFEADAVTPEQMDMLWAGGWRHFGTYFYRYELSVHRGQLCHVLPLRVVLSQFQASRSQKRVLAKNRDLQVVIRDTQLDRTRHELFLRHRERFDDNIPDSLYTFLSDEPSRVPCLNREINLYDNGRLLAASFLDIGATATSGVYAMFEPEEEKRSLGIFMILKAIEYSRGLGCELYYPGYAYREPSIYDYKKNFAALESLDWEGGWQLFSPQP
jgi:arginine-tRNA-protein transferase